MATSKMSRYYSLPTTTSTTTDMPDKSKKYTNLGSGLAGKAQRALLGRKRNLDAQIANVSASRPAKPKKVKQ